jgi:hypothetical protein
MCVKLIDVLSAHTSLIKMRIDTELVPYLSSIIYPKNENGSPHAVLTPLSLTAGTKTH